LFTAAPPIQRQTDVSDIRNQNARIPKCYGIPFERRAQFGQGPVLWVKLAP
jgi:hypothetical protein